MADISDPECLDRASPSHREKFVFPTLASLGVATTAKSHPNDNAIYLCGNSLGLMPKSTKTAIEAELSAWGERAVESHFSHPGEGKTPWMDIDLPLVDLLAPVVGAKNTEVAAMGSLTANLNALLISFYRPSGRRTKILFEKNAFPSDFYAFLNMVQLHGHDASHLVQIDVPQGETYLRTELILDTIEKHRHELALVVLPGIQYYTGQFFDIGQITKYAQDRGIKVGWDLAHAVGNVPLELHAWNVDFAAWCSYKYLNAGPGAIAGIYVHEKYTQNNSNSNYPPRLAGWWGNKAQERFKMEEKFDPIKSALSYRQSNPSVLDCVALQSSLEIFEDAGGVLELRKRSLQLTGYLEKLLVESEYYLGNDADCTQAYGFQILTPVDAGARGCQLSVKFYPDIMDQVNRYMHDRGIICDERRPNVIRIAPAPLYNTFQEVAAAAACLNEALAVIHKDFL